MTSSDKYLRARFFSYTRDQVRRFRRAAPAFEEEKDGRRTSHFTFCDLAILFSLHDESHHQQAQYGLVPPRSAPCFVDSVWKCLQCLIIIVFVFVIAMEGCQRRCHCARLFDGRKRLSTLGPNLDKAPWDTVSGGTPACLGMVSLYRRTFRATYIGKD